MVEKGKITLSVDCSDLLAVAGVALVLVGAFAIHWALAVVVFGCGLVASALRFMRRG